MKNVSQTAKQFLIEYLVGEIEKATKKEKELVLNWADVPTFEHFIADFRNDSEWFDVVLSQVFLDGWALGRPMPILSNPVNTVEMAEDGEEVRIFKIQEVYIKLTKRFNDFGAYYLVSFVEPKIIMVPTLIYEEYDPK